MRHYLKRKSIIYISHCTQLFRKQLVGNMQFDCGSLVFFCFQQFSTSNSLDFFAKLSQSLKFFLQGNLKWLIIKRCQRKITRPLKDLMSHILSELNIFLVSGLHLKTPNSVMFQKVTKFQARRETSRKWIFSPHLTQFQWGQLQSELPGRPVFRKWSCPGCA